MRSSRETTLTEIHANDDNVDSDPTPMLSIVMPIYNRAMFLADALQAIEAQGIDDYELIVVDDGSTDDSCQVFQQLAAAFARPWQYVKQENQGPAGARNTGIDIARGEFVAFYDSDDLWLPHHLTDCLQALESSPEIDWMFAACRRVNSAGEEVEPHSFYPSGKARPFLSLHTRQVGPLRIIDDPQRVACAIKHGVGQGFQLGVYRRRLFDSGLRIPAFRIGEDRMFIVQALARGAVCGYFDDVHMIYRVHEGNISGAGAKDVEHQIRVQSELIRCYEAISRLPELNESQRRTARRRLAAQYFWHYGYNVLWRHGRYAEALAAYRDGLQYAPGDWRMRKTYWLARARRLFGFDCPGRPCDAIEGEPN